MLKLIVRQAEGRKVLDRHTAVSCCITYHCLWSIGPSENQVTSSLQAMAFSPDGVWLASIGQAPERTVVLWDVGTGAMVAVGQVKEPATALCWRLDTLLPEFLTVGPVSF